MGSSAGYAAIPVLALAYAALMARKAPATARRMAAGAALLSLSILARSLDIPLCSPVPTGKHLWWHLINAVMLALMIDTLARHAAQHPTRSAA